MFRTAGTKQGTVLPIPGPEPIDFDRLWVPQMFQKQDTPDNLVEIPSVSKYGSVHSLPSVTTFDEYCG